MTGIDRIDRAMLAALQQDGRMPVAKLAERVGLSETPCARASQASRNRGFIDGYRAVLSSKALEMGVIAFAQVRFSVHDRALSDRFEREIQGIPRIVSCHNISGRRIICFRSSRAISTNTASSCATCCGRLPGVTAVESMLSLREVKRDGGRARAYEIVYTRSESDPTDQRKALGIPLIQPKLYIQEALEPNLDREASSASVDTLLS